MRNAFVYVIGWRALDTWYAGSRYREGCDPKDLWTVYFTSSKHVRSFINLNGQPDVIKVMKVFGEDTFGARLHEQRLLKRFKVLDTNRWLNKAIGGYHAGTSGPHKETTKRKIGDANRGKKHGRPSSERIEKQKATFKKNYEANFEKRFEKYSNSQKGKLVSKETATKISQTLTGRKDSDEVRAKKSIASRNLKPEVREKQAAKIRGRKWFNNGVVCVREYECPSGFKSGRLKFKQEI